MSTPSPQELNVPLTYGERAVGLTFNPSPDQAVAQCKRGYADLIDQLAYLGMGSSAQDVRDMAAEAIKHAMTAQMWAVKAPTWKPA